MGMAASQARVLLLTARKSDLELRAMFITNQKMMLSMQTEEIASEYSTAVGNKKITFTWNVESTENQSQTTDLTYDDLISVTNFAQFRVTASDGSIVVADISDSVLKEFDGVYDAATNPDGKLVPNYNNEGQWDGTYTIKDATSQDNGKRVIVNSLLNQKRIFWNALLQGNLYVEKKGTDDSTDEWNRISLLSDSSGAFSEAYDTSDDAEAEAKYETAMARIQSMEKKLDADLKQIQTQQSACEKEIESVANILKTNVETGFKVFGSS